MRMPSAFQSSGGMQVMSARPPQSHFPGDWGMRGRAWDTAPPAGALFPSDQQQFPSSANLVGQPGVVPVDYGYEADDRPMANHQSPLSQRYAAAPFRRFGRLNEPMPSGACSPYGQPLNDHSRWEMMATQTNTVQQARATESPYNHRYNVNLCSDFNSIDISPTVSPYQMQSIKEMANATQYYNPSEAGFLPRTQRVWEREEESPDDDKLLLLLLQLGTHLVTDLPDLRLHDNELDMYTL